MEGLRVRVIYNERIKLFSIFLNGIGIAIFAVGGLAPTISALYGRMASRCSNEDEAMTTSQMLLFF
jgi:hypothetical protein